MNPTTSSSTPFLIASIGYKGAKRVELLHVKKNPNKIKIYI